MISKSEYQDICSLLLREQKRSQHDVSEYPPHLQTINDHLKQHQFYRINEISLNLKYYEKSGKILKKKVYKNHTLILEKTLALHDELICDIILYDNSFLKLLDKSYYPLHS